MRLKKMGWIISLIFVMLIGCRKSTEQQITEQLSLGQKYLEEANYEEAIIAFNKIIELDPLVAEAYMGIAQCYENQSDYEEALNILDEGVQVIGRDMLPEETIERIAEVYSRLSEWFTQQGNTDLVLRCYSAIMQLQPDNEEIREKEEEIRVIQEKRPLLQKMANSLVEEITEKNTYDFQNMEILSEEFRALITGLKKPVILSVGGGLYLGVYPGGYIYYGEMEDGKRSGNGYWYYGNTRQSEKIQGTWEDDVPNGDTVIESYEIGSDGVIRESKRSGRVEKGIYVGFWDEVIKQDDGYHVFDNIFFVDGQAQRIGVDRYGQDVDAYCATCGDGNHHLVMRDGIHRIPGDY